MASYDNKLLKGDQLLTYSNLVKQSLAAKQDIIPANTYDAYGSASAVQALIPTAVSSLTNDSNYQNATQVSASINAAIAQLTGFHFEIVETLPTQGIDTNCIYLVLKSSGETGNVYTEYAYINNAWEILGDTSVSLEYLTNAEVTTIWNTAQ